MLAGSSQDGHWLMVADRIFSGWLLVAGGILSGGSWLMVTGGIFSGQRLVDGGILSKAVVGCWQDPLKKAVG